MKIIIAVLVALVMASQVSFGENKIYLHSREIDSSAERRVAALPDILPEESMHIIVQFKNIPSDEERKTLEKEGTKLLEYIPEHAWFASVTKDSLQSLRKNSMVVYIGRISEQDRMLHNLAERQKTDNFFQEKEDTITLKGHFFPDVEEEGIEDVLSKYSSEYTIDKSTFTAEISKSDVMQIAGEDKIEWVTDLIPVRTTLNTNSRALIGVDSVQADPYNLTGTGITVAEWDQGWAGNHLDIAGRTTIGDSGTCDEGCSVQSHATHVAGTVLGNGSITAANKGMAPRASLITYEWFDNESELSIEYNQSINVYNASISQNSWGLSCSPVTAACCNAVMGNYVVDNTWVDNTSRGAHGAEMAIVWAAGNERSTNSGYCGSLGLTYNTTIPMGTAKNVITVGAVDDDATMSSFSSWGPTDDGRTKPDVVANGVSVTSSVPTDSYSSSSGTSMATPAVSGSIALLHQYYKSIHNINPDPAIVKALVIHTARDLNNTGPDFTTGWGLVNITKAIEYIANDTRKSLFFMGNITGTGSTVNYTLDLGHSRSELKLTLVWSDYQGSPSISRQLINDLNLVVTNGSGSRFHPWTLDSNNPGELALRNSSDTINNVEQAVADNPVSGIWNVKINGTVPQAPQEFALIVSVFDEKPPIWFGNKTNAVSPSQNQAVQFNVTWNDTIGLSRFIFSWNDTGTWVNVTNGSITGNSANVSVNLTVTATKNKDVYWKFFANDSGHNINETAELYFTISNSIPVTASVRIAMNDNLNKSNDSMTAVLNITDTDNDNITNETLWYNNTILVTEFNNWTIITANHTTKGQNWTLSARGYDGTSYSNWVNATIRILNTPPNITSLSISSSDNLNRSNGSISSVFSVADSDNDALTNETLWYNNTILITEFNNWTTITSNHTRKGANWTLSFRSYDGSEYSTWRNTTIRIGNTAPLTVSVAVSSSDNLNRSNGSLSSVFVIIDVDNDSIVNETLWYNNTVIVAAFSNLTSVSAIYNIKHNNWTLSVRGYDGSDYSEWRNATMFINNTPPRVERVSITSNDNLNRSNGSISANFNITDFDNDNMANETLWYNNTVLVTEFNNWTIITANHTTKGQNWTLSLRGYDGSEYSSWKNATIKINNTPPSIAFINNITVNESEQLNVSVSAIDDDNDAVSYSINNTNFTLSGTIFTWNTTVNDSGQYSFNITVNDSSDRVHILVHATVLDAADVDADGIPDYKDSDDDGDNVNDTVDFVHGASANVNTTLQNIVVRINSSDNLSRVINGTFLVNITNGTLTVIEFNWTFNSSSVINLYNLTVIRQNSTASNGSLVVRGISFPVGTTKNVYVDRVSSAGYVCIKDSIITEIGNVSTGCNQDKEFFLNCNGIANGSYSCNITSSGTRYYITGLNNSGIREQCQDNDGDGYGAVCVLGTDCNDNDASKHDSCSSGSSSSSSSSGGGGGGGSGSANLVNDDNTISSNFFSMVKDKEYSISGTANLLAITKVAFYVSRPVLSGTVKTERVELPNDMQKLSNVYQYMTISTSGILITSDVTKADMSFRVKKSWLEENSIDKSTIALQRYESSWVKYGAVIEKEDSDYVHYSSAVPGFSYFAITGNKLIKSIADVSQAEANKSTEIAKTNATMPKENKEKKSYGMLWLAVPIFLIVLIVILFRRMNNKEMDRFIKEHH